MDKSASCPVSYMLARACPKCPAASRSQRFKQLFTEAASSSAGEVQTRLADALLKAALQRLTEKDGSLIAA